MDTGTSSRPEHGYLYSRWDKPDRLGEALFRLAGEGLWTHTHTGCVWIQTDSRRQWPDEVFQVVKARGGNGVELGTQTILYRNISRKRGWKGVMFQVSPALSLPPLLSRWSCVGDPCSQSSSPAGSKCRGPPAPFFSSWLTGGSVAASLFSAGHC